jgi:hypothetical protein
MTLADRFEAELAEELAAVMAFEPPDEAVKKVDGVLRARLCGWWTAKFDFSKMRPNRRAGVEVEYFPSEWEMRTIAVAVG